MIIEEAVLRRGQSWDIRSVAFGCPTRYVCGGQQEMR